MTAAAARAGSAGPAVPISIDGSLSGVAAISANSAWAVGYTFSSRGNPAKTVIVGWNGAAWKRMPSPSPGAASALYGVAAVSASSAWAVGYTTTSTGSKTLILRWNGATWTRIPSPTPGNGGALTGVAASSAGSAWAVGSTGSAKPLILRWNGTAWKRVPSPSPAAQPSSAWPPPPPAAPGRWA